MRFADHIDGFTETKKRRKEELKGVG